MKLMLGNCLDRLKELDDNSVDSVVTDPPYGLSFMGKKWDYDVPAVNIWEECFRVLKPGGHLLAFAGTRTQHRMAVNIEDAGFEIRDMIAWVYGSGFPKSHNISKAIDKAAGAKRTVKKGVKPGHEDFANRKTKGHLTGGDKGWKRPWMEKDSADDYHYDFEPATPEAQQWEGWGTALKPALEPITVARKPIAEKSIAENVLKYGTGGLNIDASRVEINPDVDDPRLGGNGSWSTAKAGSTVGNLSNQGKIVGSSSLGRFPANLIHDGSDEVLDAFPNAKSGGKGSHSGGDNKIYSPGLGADVKPYGDQGSAARFFYCAKASKKDRDEGLDDFDEQQFVQWQTGNGASGKPSSMSEGRDTKRKNTHPTVKPTDLMKYLVRMVTPKGGVVLDPFMGSGSTGKACKLEGFDFIGIEMDEEYFLLAKSRIDGIMVENTLEDFFA